MEKKMLKRSVTWILMKPFRFLSTTCTIKLLSLVLYVSKECLILDILCNRWWTTALRTEVHLQGKLCKNSLILKGIFQNKFHFWAVKKLTITLQLNMNSFIFRPPLDHLLKDTFDSEN